MDHDALLDDMSMSDSDGDDMAATASLLSAAPPAALDAMLDDMSSDSEEEAAASTPASKNLDSMLDDMSSDSEDGGATPAPTPKAPSSLSRPATSVAGQPRSSAQDWGATLRAVLPQDLAGEWESKIRSDGIHQLRLPARPRPPSHAYRAGRRGKPGSGDAASMSPEKLLETILEAAVKQSGCKPAAAVLAPTPELIALYKQQLLADIPQVELNKADVDAQRFPALTKLQP